MTWFRVDDKMHSHPKVQVSDTDLLEAIGLWTLAGSHCADYLTDGVVEAHVIYRITLDRARAERLADVLVRMGFWDVREEGGWAFRDWNDYQPTRESIEKTSSKRAASGRKGGRSKSEANAKQNALGLLSKREANDKQLAKQNSSKGIPNPYPIPIPNPDQETTPLPPAGGTVVGSDSGSANPPAAAPADPGMGSDPSDTPIVNPGASSPQQSASTPPTDALPPGSEPNLQRQGNFGMEATWWAQGIQAGTGNPCRIPDRFECRTLSGALAAHAKGLSSEAMELFVRGSAKAFAETLKPGGAVHMKAYAGWLDAGNYKPPKPKPPAAAKFPPLIQRPANEAAGDANALLDVLGIGKIGNGGSRA